MLIYELINVERRYGFNNVKVLSVCEIFIVWASVLCSYTLKFLTDLQCPKGKALDLNKYCTR